jgi:hypothetical protein
LEGTGVRLTVHLDDGVGDLDLVERHGRPALPRRSPREGRGQSAKQAAGWDGMGLVGVLERKMTEGRSVGVEGLILNCCRSMSVFKLLSLDFFVLYSIICII